MHSKKIGKFQGQIETARKEAISDSATRQPESAAGDGGAGSNRDGRKNPDELPGETAC
jgi:hypothetical protein